MQKGRLVANENNLGGRNAIRRQLLEHQNAIVHAKPTIDTRAKPPTHVDAKVDPKKKLSRGQGAFEFNEVYHSFKKVANIKSGYIDSKEPESFGLKKKALPKNKKANDYINQEHLLHLKSQQRRIESIGKSMVERKKNQFDPVAHPSVFLRRPDQSTKDITLDYMFSSKPGAFTATTGFSLSKMKNKLTKRPLSAFNASKFDEEDTTSMMAPTQAIPANIKTNDIPEFSGQPNDDAAYRNYKMKIIDHIIEHRLYKAIDLDLLREKVKFKNPKLDQHKLEDMFEQINIDLDK